MRRALIVAVCFVLAAAAPAVPMPAPWLAYVSGPAGQAQILAAPVRRRRRSRCLDVDSDAVRWLATGYGPVWSPDGAWLAFTASRVGSASVAVAPARGGDMRVLTDPRRIGVRPLWSPDGAYLAFITIADGDAAVHVAPPDGADERRLDTAHTDFSTGPLIAWRPR